jgi:choline dehydrogenase-like flavoprotein
MAKDEIFDATIIASGATGGWAARELTEAGMKVIVLEARPETGPRDGFSRAHLALRAKIPRQC